MGGEPGDVEEITILNRKLVWSGNEMKDEADPKHAEMISSGVGLDARPKGMDRPSVKETITEVEDEERSEVLDPAEATEYRALAARANYLAADRPDVGYAVKELCRDMSAPRKSSQAKLKRLGRYLLEFPRLGWTYPDGQVEVDMKNIHVFSDSDWAGCIRTRKSTSGGLVILGGVSLNQ